MGVDIAGIVTLTSPAGATLAMSNWMNVDASGILTRPQTPHMRGHLTGRGSPYVANPLLVTSVVDVGGNWNNATGYWTCPVAGYYMVTMGGICGGLSGSQYAYIYINKNGVAVAATHYNHAGTWHYVGLSCILLCAAGDTISYQVGNGNPAGSGIYGEDGHEMFSIALMA
jgi:hypothetical protein